MPDLVTFRVCNARHQPPLTVAPLPYPPRSCYILPRKWRIEITLPRYIGKGSHYVQGTWKSSCCRNVRGPQGLPATKTCFNACISIPTMAVLLGNRFVSLPPSLGDQQHVNPDPLTINFFGYAGNYLVQESVHNKFVAVLNWGISFAIRIDRLVPQERSTSKSLEKAKKCLSSVCRARMMPEH